MKRERKSQRKSLDKLPELIRALDEGSEEEQCQALLLLCPCRKRIYDRQIWQKIFRAKDSDDSFKVRHQAQHAIITLQQRAWQDPRSLQLLLELEADLKKDLVGEGFTIGLCGPRSRPSRRKRMTYCKNGHRKARAFLQFESSLNKVNGNGNSDGNIT